MKRIICLFLLVSVLLSVLVACSKKTPQQEQGSTDAVETESVTDSETEGEVIEYDEKGYQKDKLPDDVNYGGKDVTIFGWTNRFNEFKPVENATDEVSYQLFTRNLKVEERFGVTLNWLDAPCDYSNQTSWVTTVQNNAMSGDVLYDIVAGYSMTNMTLASQGYLVNLAGCNYIDFSNPWWPSTLVEQASINGKIYGASGDIAVSYYDNMYFILMNNDLFDSENVEGDPLGDVKDGTWTIEKMLSYAKNVVLDPNGNGKDSADTFGFVLKSVTQVDAFVAGANFKFIDLDTDGIFKISKDIENVDKGDKFVSTLAGAIHSENYAWYGNGSTDADAMLIDGRILFYTMTINNLGRKLNEGLEFDYYILPVPKWDTDQEQYYTNLGFEYTMYGIPNSGRDTDISALVIEALASEGYRTTTPAMYETKVKNRYSGDQSENVETFELLRNTTYFEPTRFLYKVLESRKVNPISALRTCVCDNSATWSSKVGALRLGLATYLKDDLTPAFRSQE